MVSCTVTSSLDVISSLYIARGVAVPFFAGSRDTPALRVTVLKRVFFSTFLDYFVFVFVFYIYCLFVLLVCFFVCFLFCLFVFLFVCLFLFCKEDLESPLPFLRCSLFC
jgi:hypothetical protein